MQFLYSSTSQLFFFHVYMTRDGLFFFFPLLSFRVFSFLISDSIAEQLI